MSPTGIEPVSPGWTLRCTTLERVQAPRASRKRPQTGMLTTTPRGLLLIRAALSTFMRVDKGMESMRAVPFPFHYGLGTGLPAY